MDLGPTRTDFNIGTPRSEIPSHSLQMITTPVILRLQTQLKDEVTFKNTTTNIVLHSFGVVHKLRVSLFKRFRAVNKIQLKAQS